MSVAVVVSVVVIDELGENVSDALLLPVTVIVGDSDDEAEGVTLPVAE